MSEGPEVGRPVRLGCREWGLTGMLRKKKLGWDRLF